MSESFGKDLEYLAQVTLLTFIILSLVVIYNQKIAEGIILLTFCIQLLLIWLIFEKYDTAELIKVFSFNTNPKLKEGNSYFPFLGVFGLFIAGLILLFRGLVLAQHSIITFNEIQADRYFEIMVFSIVGLVIVILAVILYITRLKLEKKNKNINDVVPA
jgi:uncharacterized membrane protein